MRPISGRGLNPVVWSTLALFALLAAGCSAAVAPTTPSIPVTTSSPVAPTPGPTIAPTIAPTTAPTTAPTFGPHGTFVPTGSMTLGRDSATATLLLDGRVLVAGGEGYDAARSAELYDPTTGTFSPTGSLTVGREVATATRLLDGRVLLVGGWEWTDKNHRAESASAELYDPKIGTFTRTGSLPQARHFATATRLVDGRVLLAGGELGTNSQETATAMLYDPATGKFSQTGSMNHARIFHTATLLLDGRVLVAGGNGLDQSAELYDPATGKFSQTGSMTVVNQDHTATLLSDGRVLVAGGGQKSGVSYPAAELYDPKTGTFGGTGSMISSCECTGPIGSPGSAPLLSDGRVFVLDTDGVAELYDPKTGTFSATGSMSRARQGFTTTLLGDGRVLIAGTIGPIYGGPMPSLSPAQIAAIDADRSSAELYVP